MRKTYVFFIILFTGCFLFPFNVSAQDCEPTDCQECCMLSDGTWIQNDFNGTNPTLSGSGDNWELSSAAWISTEETLAENCSLSAGTWTQNDYMGTNPTLSGFSDNWELSSAAWISTEETLTECFLSDGTWTQNDYMGTNPTLSGSGDNWELSSAAWILTEETDNGDGTITNNLVYGANDTNLSTLTSDCYDGEVSIAIEYTTNVGGISPIGDIGFSISSEDDGLLTFTSASSITGLEMVDGILVATGSITGGDSGLATTTNNLVYGANDTNPSTLTSDCYDGEVSIEIEYATNYQAEIIGDIGFSIISGDGLLTLTSTSSITGLEMVDGIFVATGSITGGDSGLATTTNNLVYGSNDTNPSTLTSDCYDGEVSIEIEYATNYQAEIIGDIGFSIISGDGLLTFTSTSLITGLEMVDGIFVATGSITGGDSGLATTTNNLVYGANDTNPPTLTSDCYDGEVSIEIEYATNYQAEIIGDIGFSIISGDGLLTFISTSLITGLEIVDGILVATGSITGGNSGILIDIDTDSDGVPDCNEVEGCTDSEACNYDSDPTTDTDNTLCTYVDGICDTCENSLVVDNDLDDDGVCDDDEITGCTDESACNYDSSATDDDGSCYNNDLGCGCDNPEADAGYDCDGNCLTDSDGDGVCDEFEIAGCTDASACNYSADATDDNDSCNNDWPSVPFVNQLSSTILTTLESYPKYQWWKDDALMDGDTLQTVLVFVSGYYTVEVFDETGECSVMSDNGVQYGEGEETGQEPPQAMTLYPNPSNSFIYLESSEDFGKQYFVDIYDNLGRLVLQTDNQSQQLDILPINLVTLKPSFYSVIVRHTNGKVWNQTLIKK